MNKYFLLYQHHLWQDLNNKEACEIEIEDLFPADVLEHEINGRKFSKKDSTHDNGFYGKNEFSQYVYSNYESIDFSNFISLLSAINEIIELYPNFISNSRLSA